MRAGKDLLLLLGWTLSAAVFDSAWASAPDDSDAFKATTVEVFSPQGSVKAVRQVQDRIRVRSGHGGKGLLHDLLRQGQAG